MSPTRLYCPSPLQPQQRYVLDTQQSHYLARVLRLRVGNVITVFDGNGGEYPATILVIGKQAVEIETAAPLCRECESPLYVHLVLGLSKGDRMDFVVQKATELGVAKITAVITEFTAVRLDRKRLDKKQQHWQRIAESACEQSGRNRVPAIESPLPISDWFAANEGSLSHGIILKPGAGALPASGETATTVILLIGPEGGFSATEYAQAAAAGIVAIGLGPRVLRTETAAITAISLVQGLWGDMRLLE